MTFHYDSSTDLLFAAIATVPALNIKVEPGVVVRVSTATRRAVGVEVVDASATLGVSQSSITADFALDLIDRYGPKAERKLATANQASPA